MFYKSIEKVTTQVYSPCSGFMLNHVVKLAHKRGDGKRELFHNEYTYSNNSAYIDSSSMTSVKLKFSSYLLFEELAPEKDWSIRQNIYISLTNIHTIVRNLKEVRKWFYKKKYKDLYYMDEGILKLDKEVVKSMSMQFNMSGKTIIIHPSVLIRGDKDFEGMKMYINSASVVAELTIDQLDVLYHVLKEFDLYLAGLSLISYIGRPTEGAVMKKDIKPNYEKTEDQKYHEKFGNSKGVEAYNARYQRDANKSKEFGDYFK